MISELESPRSDFDTVTQSGAASSLEAASAKSVIAEEIDASVDTNSVIEVLSIAASDNTEWMRVPFEERDRRFQLEGRDHAWAGSMERAIAAKVPALDPQPTALLRTECRETLCMVVTYYSPNPFRGLEGPEFHELYELGLDHQGQLSGRNEGNGIQVVMIARRR